MARRHNKQVQLGLVEALVACEAKLAAMDEAMRGTQILGVATLEYNVMRHHTQPQPHSCNYNSNSSSSYHCSRTSPYHSGAVHTVPGLSNVMPAAEGL